MDKVSVTGLVEYEAFAIPETAFVVVGKNKAEVHLDDVPTDALDALSQMWLNHLYAGLNRKPPILKPSQGE